MDKDKNGNNNDDFILEPDFDSEEEPQKEENIEEVDPFDDRENLDELVQEDEVLEREEENKVLEGQLEDYNSAQNHNTNYINEHDEEDENIEKAFDEDQNFVRETPVSSLKNKETRNNLLKYMLFGIIAVVGIVFLLQYGLKNIINKPTHSTTESDLSETKRSDIVFDPFERGGSERGGSKAVTEVVEEESREQVQEEGQPVIDIALLRGASRMSGPMSIGSNNSSSSDEDLNSGEIALKDNGVIDPNDIELDDPMLGALSEEKGRSNKNTHDRNRYKATDYEMVSAKKLHFDPNLTLEKGTFIPCVMNTRFISTIAGEITCTITDDVYSKNNNVLLVEKGSKAYGKYNSSTLEIGEERVFVIWEEIRTPNNISIAVQSNATGELGESGAGIRVDEHFRKRFGTALLVSLISNISNYATAVLADRASKKRDGGSGGGSSIENMRRKQAEDTTSQSTEIITSILQKQMDIQPTGYKNQGEFIGIYVARDVDFSKIYKLKKVF